MILHIFSTNEDFIVPNSNFFRSYDKFSIKKLNIMSKFQLFTKNSMIFKRLIGSKQLLNKWSYTKRIQNKSNNQYVIIITSECNSVISFGIIDENT